jgi:hypothetical protein
VQRGVLRRSGAVHDTPRDVQYVAVRELELVNDLANLLNFRVKALVGHRKLWLLVKDLPALCAGDLRYDNVVRVIVRDEAGRVARRQIDVGLRPHRQLAFQIAAGVAKRREQEMQHRQDERRAVFELLEHL